MKLSPSPIAGVTSSSVATTSSTSTGSSSVGSISIGASVRFDIHFDDTRLMAALFGAFDCNLTLLEKRLHITIAARGAHLLIEGEAAVAECAKNILQALYERILQGQEVDVGLVEGLIASSLPITNPTIPSSPPPNIMSVSTDRDVKRDRAHDRIFESGENIEFNTKSDDIIDPRDSHDVAKNSHIIEFSQSNDSHKTPQPIIESANIALSPQLIIRTRRKNIAPRSSAQIRYIQALRNHDITFALGPAGTGKTYIAVAQAVAEYSSGSVERLILSRPAVEAGEHLGFLPGDMKDKIDPYLRPLYDALYDCLPTSQVERRIESGEIEIAPLAFMRGRTLADAFIILDEAQNCSIPQMKMFLTRFGTNSRMVVCGDPSQVDLPAPTQSGLIDAVARLETVDDIAVVRFGAGDVVRHPLVGHIVAAYAAQDVEASHNRNIAQNTHADLNEGGRRRR